MSKDIDVRDVRAGDEVEIVVRRGVLVGLVGAAGDAARALVVAGDAVGDAARVAARVAARALVVADRPIKPKPKGTTHEHRNHQPAAALPTA